MRVELYPDVLDELHSVAQWYSERRDGLGEQFTSAVANLLRNVAVAPASFPPWQGIERPGPVIRKALVDRFPYVVAYEQHDGFILVLSIAHEKRRPLYWLIRSSHGFS